MVSGRATLPSMARRAPYAILRRADRLGAGGSPTSPEQRARSSPTRDARASSSPESQATATSSKERATADERPCTAGDGNRTEAGATTAIACIGASSTRAGSDSSHTRHAPIPTRSSPARSVPRQQRIREPRPSSAASAATRASEHLSPVPTARTRAPAATASWDPARASWMSVKLIIVQGTPNKAYLYKARAAGANLGTSAARYSLAMRARERNSRP